MKEISQTTIYDNVKKTSLKLFCEKNKSIKKMKVRILIGFLVFMATTVSYILRVNLNIALVTMTDLDDMTRSLYCNTTTTK